MADKDDETRDQKPTAKRLRKALEMGQVSQSKELTGAISLATGVIGLALLMPGISVQLAGLFEMIWQLIAGAQAHTYPKLLALAFDVLTDIVAQVFLLVVVIAILVSRLQAGAVFSLEPVKAKLERVNPATNLKNIFSGKSLVMLALMVLKAAIIIFGIFVVFSAYMGDAVRMVLGGAGAAIVTSGDALMALLAWGVIGFLLASGLDFSFQRFNFQRDMRMSRREIKREVKEDQGDPIIKSARRQGGQEGGGTSQLEYVDRCALLLCDDGGRVIGLIYLPDQNPKPIVAMRAGGVIGQKAQKIAQDNRRPIVADSFTVEQLWPFARGGFTVPDRFAPSLIKLIEQYT